MKSNNKTFENFSYLLKLLSCSLNDTIPEKPNADTDWASVFLMAKSHSVAGMAYCAIKRLSPEDLPPENILADFKEYYEYQLLTDFNVDYETEIILNELAERKLYAMPLKGYILKHDYPIPAMRTMSDVDLLYMKSQRKQIKEYFIERGYTFERRLDNEMDFTKGEIHHYEVHENLASQDRIAHDYFSRIWDRVKFRNGYIGEMSLEDFYIYLLEHLAHHFEHGGVGVRMFMDIYVFKINHGDCLDNVYVENVLKKLNLTDFRQKAEALSFRWLAEGEIGEVCDELVDFIIHSETFGRVEVSVVSDTVRREETKGRTTTPLGNIICKLFPSYSFIAKNFPTAEKHKVLYPLFIIVYWFRRIFCERNIRLKSINSYLETGQSDTAMTFKKVRKEMGLDKGKR